MKMKLLTGLLLLVSVAANQAHGWYDHFLITYKALEKTAVGCSEAVLVEPLENFLGDDAVQDKLVLTFQNIEQWCQASGCVDKYPPLLEDPAISFQKIASDDGVMLKKWFVRTLRIHPGMNFDMYLPVDLVGRDNRMVVKTSAVFPVAGGIDRGLVKIEYGQPVLPIDLISAAANEPDLGLDCLLWKDSENSVGKVYNFGDQPFGDKRLSYGTQAPFHMGFYSENFLIYLFASFLKKSLATYRHYQFVELAKLSFVTDHPYWGYRFLGWAAHYLQDMSQPYHATSAPNTSTMSMLWAGFLDAIGISNAKETILQHSSSMHAGIERVVGIIVAFAFERLVKSLRAKRTNVPFDATLKEHPLVSKLMNDLSDPAGDVGYRASEKIPSYEASYLRTVVATRSYAIADMADVLLAKALPKNYVEDNKYAECFVPKAIADEDKDTIHLQGMPLEEIMPLLQFVFQELGVHTRNLVQGCVPQNGLFWKRAV